MQRSKFGKCGLKVHQIVKAIDHFTDALGPADEFEKRLMKCFSWLDLHSGES